MSHIFLNNNNCYILHLLFSGACFNWFTEACTTLEKKTMEKISLNNLVKFLHVYSFFWLFAKFLNNDY